MRNYLLQYQKFSQLERQAATELEAYQSMLFKQLLGYTLDHVAFYQRKYRDCGVKIPGIQSICDLISLPIISKTEMKAHNVRELVSDQYDLEQLNYISSSGSTGEPFRTYFSDQDKQHRELFTFHTYRSHGLKLFDKKAYFQNASRAKTNERFFQKLGILRSYPYAVDLGFSKIYDEMVKENIRVLEGCPTNVYFIGEANLQKKKLDIRHIFLYGELFSDELRRKLKQFFPKARICNAYGLVEVGHVGYECEAENGFHINPNCYVEIVENDQILGDNETGEIVVTTLKQYTMPYIRYNTRDLGTITHSPCSCGRTSPRIMNLQGRSSNFFLNKKNEKVATQFFYVGTKFLGEIKQYTVVQNEVGLLEITIALPKELDRIDFERRFLESLKERFADSFDFQISFVTDLNIVPSGKFWAIKSNLTINE